MPTPTDVLVRRSSGPDVDVPRTLARPSHIGSSAGRTAARIFDSLQRDWQRASLSAAALAEVARWAEVEPELRDGAGDVVSRVTWAGYRPSPAGAAVLSALLRQATGPFAARALLQALLPRVKAERVRTPTYGHGLGESWPSPADTMADLVAECFAAIKRHAGEDRTDVDRLVVAEAARRLRTARQAQRRYQSRNATLLDRHCLVVTGELSSALSDAERLAGAVVEAVREGRLAPEQARLVYATRVKGFPASEVARRQGMQPGAVYYALATAERALLASLTACQRRPGLPAGHGRRRASGPPVRPRPPGPGRSAA